MAGRAEVVRVMAFLNWVRTIKPGIALKWGGVVLAYAIAILLVVNIIIATVEAHSMKTSAVWPLISVAIEREDIAVDVIHQIKVPDEEWRFVDKAGHGHFWRGKKVPTCKLVVTGTTWIGDEYDGEEVEIKEWQCRLCKEIIEPGYRMQFGADPRPRSDLGHRHD